jgi:hypothetical protein
MPLIVGTFTLVPSVGVLAESSAVRSVVAPKEHETDRLSWSSLIDGALGKCTNDVRPHPAPTLV